VKIKENIFVKFDILMTKWYIHCLSNVFLLLNISLKKIW